jgi:hypothetical protein
MIVWAHGIPVFCSHMNILISTKYIYFGEVQKQKTLYIVLCNQFSYLSVLLSLLVKPADLY